MRRREYEGHPRTVAVGKRGRINTFDWSFGIVVYFISRCVVNCTLNTADCLSPFHDISLMKPAKPFNDALGLQSLAFSVCFVRK